LHQQIRSQLRRKAAFECAVSPERALSFCLRMISAQTRRVCRRENRYPLFRLML
jgi:hypothetical protein